MGPFRDGAGDLGEVEVHRLGVGAGQHEACGDSTSGADSTEDVAPLVAGVALGAGSGAASGPDAGDCALLADARFILEPYFQRLTLRSLGDRRSYRLGEVFLNAVWASGSDFGCCGRTDNRRKPSAANCLPTVRSCRVTPNSAAMRA